MNSFQAQPRSLQDVSLLQSESLLKKSGIELLIPRSHSAARSSLVIQIQSANKYDNRLQFIEPTDKAVSLGAGGKAVGLGTALLAAGPGFGKQILLQGVSRRFPCLSPLLLPDLSLHQPNPIPDSFCHCPVTPSPSWLSDSPIDPSIDPHSNTISKEPSQPGQAMGRQMTGTEELWQTRVCGQQIQRDPPVPSSGMSQHRVLPQESLEHPLLLLQTTPGKFQAEREELELPQHCRNSPGDEMPRSHFTCIKIYPQKNPHKAEQCQPRAPWAGVNELNWAFPSQIKALKRRFLLTLLCQQPERASSDQTPAR